MTSPDDNQETKWPRVFLMLQPGGPLVSPAPRRGDTPLDPAPNLLHRLKETDKHRLGLRCHDPTMQRASCWNWEDRAKRRPSALRGDRSGIGRLL